MNFTQRAFAYISRKKGKTVSLFLVVFVVAVFLISCFGVLNASERLSRDIRTSLGAAFYIRANTEVSMNENGETQVKENTVHISWKEIDEIMQTGEIKYYNPINYGFAKSDTIQFVQGDKHTAENNMGKVTALRFSALAPNFTDETAVLVEADRANKDGECWPAIPTIAAELKLSQSTVRRALGDLRKAGLLETEQRYRTKGGKSSLLYKIHNR